LLPGANALHGFSVESATYAARLMTLDQYESDDFTFFRFTQYSAAQILRYFAY
jgi:hypothetical protein